jgi:phage terminase large subunit GpA-like protein
MNEGYTEQEWNIGLKSVAAALDTLWTEKSNLTVSEYAEEKRTLPVGTPFPGPWSNSKTPYLDEIMDAMSANSEIQHIIIAKAAQLGLSAAAENVTLYWMDEQPAEILFISATDALLKKWVHKRLEPAIDSVGMRAKIFAQARGTGQRRSGDRVFSKEYAGGCLDMSSAQSPASLRSDSKRILIRDEIDGAPRDLKTGEGNWLKVSYVRTNAFGKRRKILDFSTPTTYDDSAVWPEYLKGDQRRYFVPCPHCGAYQILEWGTEDDPDGPGMKWVVKNGRVKKVWYQCEHCEEPIKNHHKDFMLTNGEWRATATAVHAQTRSYHLSSIYSPVGMLSWEEMVEAYLEAQQEFQGMRSFRNLYLGLPYKETGERPSSEIVKRLRAPYASGTIPSDNILFLTMAIDVQKGTKRNEKYPPRIELEVCGHGRGYRTWSVMYKVFAGSVDDVESGAWKELNDFAVDGGFEFERADGMKFEPQLTLIDSGYNAPIVYQFCKSWQNTFPCKGRGQGQIAMKRDDGPNIGTLRGFTLGRVLGDLRVVNISTDFYKQNIYTDLKKVAQNPLGKTPAGFCCFPMDYPGEYFDQLVAEEMDEKGIFHARQGIRNEALDIRVYNRAACDFYLYEWVQKYREIYKKRGCTREQLEEIGTEMILDLLEEKVSGG